MVPGLKAIVFDVFGTVVDWRGSIAADLGGWGAARGIEARTRKLFEVCRLRDIPIVTFVNKLDRETRDPFDLLDEIEKTLALDVAPMTWPLGQGRGFVGTYDLERKQVRRLDADAVASALRSVSVPADAAPALVVGGREQVERQQLQAAQRAVIAGSDRPIVELPYLPDGIDLGSLFDLARSLREDLLEAGAA